MADFDFSVHLYGISVSISAEEVADMCPVGATDEEIEEIIGQIIHDHVHDNLGYSVRKSTSKVVATVREILAAAAD